MVAMSPPILRTMIGNGLGASGPSVLGEVARENARHEQVVLAAIDEGRQQALDLGPMRVPRRIM